MGIGTKIKALRQEKRLSQEILSEQLNISQATLSNIELEKSVPDVILLQQFADALDVLLYDLLDNQNIIINNNQQSGNSGNGYSVYELSEKIIDLYESRIKEKDSLILILQNQLKLSIKQ